MSIESVDRQLANGFRFVRFEPLLEKAYNDETRVERVRYLIFTGIIALVLYDLFLIGDWQMLPDVFVDACISRLMIFTPMVLIAFFVMKPSMPLPMREGIAGGITILSVVLMTSVFLQSYSAYRVTYHYGTVMIMMFCAVVQRLQFYYAVLTIIAMLIVQIAEMALSDAFDGAMIRSDTTFFTAAAILILVAAYGLERENRRGYLLAVRSRLLNDQLEQMANIDPLTSLWNRRYLDGAMRAAWDGVASMPISMSVILLDIDHFKAFNDSRGHLEGDLCLQRIGRCLRSSLGGSNEVLARFGGEEFLIFIPGLNAAQAGAIAGRLRQAVRDESIPHPILGTKKIVTASFGVAAAPASDMTPAALMAAADQALYRAKDQGRDRVVLADEIDGFNPIYASAS